MVFNYKTDTTQKVYNTIPCPSPNGAQGADYWFIVKVKNTTASVKKVVLFDASSNFQIKEGVQTQDGVEISGISLPYDVILNDLASTEQYCFDQTNVEITEGDVLQLDRTWQIKKSIPFSNGTALVQEIFPSTAKNSMQQQKDRLEVHTPITMTRKRTWEFSMEPQTTMVLRMHLSRAVLNG